MGIQGVFRGLFGIVACLSASGCLICQTSVSNPLPGLSTVAVVPFFNLSQEKVVDGRRFAMAYFAELQKVPGFQVVPVGVTEQAIIDNQLEMKDAADVLKLARILNVDAIAVGAVTDYDPYYPPRIGLQVSWYSPHPWLLAPMVPVDPATGSPLAPAYSPPQTVGMSQLPGRLEAYPTPRPVVRAQSGEPHLIEGRSDDAAASQPQLIGEPGPLPPDGSAAPPSEFAAPPAEFAAPQPAQPPAADPRAALAEWPFMSHIRIFDGADAAVVARLSNYVDLSGDRRSGGWEAYLHRSEDFIRFTAHVMIVEMLTLHGAEPQRRWVLKWRKLQ